MQKILKKKQYKTQLREKELVEEDEEMEEEKQPKLKQKKEKADEFFAEGEEQEPLTSQDKKIVFRDGTIDKPPRLARPPRSSPQPRHQSRPFSSKPPPATPP